jgi:hypothetical protein
MCKTDKMSPIAAPASPGSSAIAKIAGATATVKSKALPSQPPKQKASIPSAARVTRSMERVFKKDRPAARDVM